MAGKRSVRGICVAVVVCAAAVCDARPLTEWAVWGPGWGRGGLAVARYGNEGRLHPQPGDLDFSAGWRGRGMVAWRYHKSDEGTMDLLSERFPRLRAALTDDKSTVWAGCAAYLHTYLHVPESRRVVLTVTASQPRTVWLNGRECDSEEVSLRRGWNRLLIRTLSPSMVRGRTPRVATEERPGNWRLQVSLLDAMEEELENLRETAYDPRRAPLITTEGTAIRYLSTIERPGYPGPIFLKGDAVECRYRIRLGIGPADSYQTRSERERPFGGMPWAYSLDPALLKSREQSSVLKKLDPQRVDSGNLVAKAPARLELDVLDYDGETVQETSYPLTWNASSQNELYADVDLKSGVLPLGHYVVISRLIDARGRVQMRDNWHSFSVIRGPLKAADSDSRYLGTVGHWLLSRDTESAVSRMRWLHQVGLRGHQKLSQAWSAWGIRHDGKGNVSFEPQEKVRRVLAEANRLGITVVGDLIPGYPLSAKGRTVKLSAAEKKEIEANGIDTSQPAQLVLQPWGARPLPPYGTDAFEKTLRDYVSRLVSHYRGRIRYWGGTNEIDLHANPGTDLVARVFAEATRIIYETLKETDPEAVFVNSSLSRRSAFTQKLLNHNYLDYCDIVDVHAHPARVPDLEAYTIGNNRREGLGIVKAFMAEHGFSKPVWYGELSPPMAHSPRGARGQPAGIVKQLAWAMASDKVEALSYLVVYNGPDYKWPGGFNNFYGDPLPGVNAVNTASHVLDGRRVLPPVKELPTGVEQLRAVDEAGLETLVLWSQTSQTVEVPAGDTTVRALDVIGRPLKVTRRDGKVVFRVNRDPVYLLGRF